MPGNRVLTTLAGLYLIQQLSALSIHSATFDEVETSSLKVEQLVVFCFGKNNAGYTEMEHIISNASPGFDLVDYVFVDCAKDHSRQACENAGFSAEQPVIFLDSKEGGVEKFEGQLGLGDESLAEFIAFRMLPLGSDNVVQFRSVEQFEALVSKQIVLLKFQEDWCEECKRMQKHFQRASQDFSSGSGFVFLDVDCGKHASFCGTYDITTYPQMRVLVSNRVEKFEAKYYGTIIKRLQSFVSTAPVTKKPAAAPANAARSSQSLFDQAVAASNAGQSEKAVELFRQILNDDVMNPKYHSNLAVALTRLGNGPIPNWREIYQEAHRESTAALMLQPDLPSALEIREQIVGNIAKRVASEFSDEGLRATALKRIIAGAYSDMTGDGFTPPGSTVTDIVDSSGSSEQNSDQQQSTAPVLDAQLWDFLVGHGLDHRYDAMYDYGIDAMDLLAEVDRADLDAVGFTASERQVLLKALNGDGNPAHAEL